jgi:hypothetical protein
MGGLRFAILTSGVVRPLEQSRVAVRTREIYRSANGDRWLLAQDP